MSKFDNEKVKLQLIPPEAIEQIGKCFTFGSGKYGDYNWMKGIQFNRLIGSYKRHLLEFELGSDIDLESKLPHLAHAATNILMLMWYCEHRKDFDDRKFSIFNEELEPEPEPEESTYELFPNLYPKEECKNQECNHHKEWTL